MNAKKLLALLLALVMVLSVAACAKTDPTQGTTKGSSPTQGTDPQPTDPVEPDPVYTGYMGDLEDYRAYIKDDLQCVLDGIGNVDGGPIDAAIAVAFETAKKNIEACKTVADIQAAFVAGKAAIAECIPLADGVFDYTSLSNAQKTEILGLLEAYAVRTGIAGVTLFENGSYVMYGDRIVLGTENYIPGYGFGTLAEGKITAALATEANDAWKMYYHSIVSDDPGTANYLNSQGSDVGDVYGYIGASYYTTFMNANKDGYDWVPELAVADPEPLNLNPETNQATKWRMELRQDLKYNTLGSRTAYNDRAVALEDFITPFKLLFNQANGMYRGTEGANATGAAAIVGVKAYYDATANAKKGILNDEEASWAGVSLKAYEEDGKWYMEFELGAPVNTYYARYYISSSLYMPVPADFIAEVGVDNYLGFSSDGKTTPVDNSLSLGAYTLEKWDSDQQIVYKKNPNYVYASTKYAAEGVHLNVLPAAKDDKEASIKEFLAGKTDASGIPDTYLEQYKSDPRTRRTTGDSCFKLNMNALDAETWEYYFGENGVVCQTPKDQYWTVEPAMNNAHFRSALSYALDRNSFAAVKGAISSVNYLSSNYMSDPENGISYSMTEAHKKAIANLLRDTDDGGFSMELARDYFRLALDEMEAAGIYTPGTPENPTVIEINVFWMYAAHEEGYHKYVKQYWEDAFNDPSVSGGKYKLDVTFSVGETYMAAYDAMMTGQFDVGFGSISGNSLNPLGFMSVLSSDQTISGGFTLNWGVDTNDPNADILVFDGMRWSFDALYKAANEVGIIKDGANQAAVSLGEQELVMDGDKAKVALTVGYAEGVKLSVDDLVIFGYIGGNYEEHSVMEFVVGEPVHDEANNTFTFNLEIPADNFNQYDAGNNQGIDVYWGYEIEAAGVTVPSGFGATFYFTFVG